MNIDLSAQVVIVTGAGRGIGKEIALMSAEAGAKVMLVARSQDQLQAVAAEIKDKGGHAEVYPCDLTEPEVAKAVVKATVDAFGRVDVLVNNAGTNYIANLIMSKDKGWRDVYELNMFAVVRLTQQVLRQLIRQKSGRIINISSVSAKIGAAYNAAYASSKAALIGMTKSVAREVSKLGITVNAICPWHVDTELVHESMGNRAKMFGKSAEAYIEEIVAESPQQRMITAREIGAAAVFLMSHEARGITGQALNVDGGTVMD